MASHPWGRNCRWQSSCDRRRFSDQSTARCPQRRIDRGQKEANPADEASRLFRRAQTPPIPKNAIERSQGGTVLTVPILPLQKEEHAMTMLKVVEVLAESEQSWEQAAQHATTAAKTIRNISSIHIENFEGQVKDGKIIQYRVNGKISFALE
jgi:flavin-binding protein dodecin